MFFEGEFVHATIFIIPSLRNLEFKYGFKNIYIYIKDSILCLKKQKTQYFICEIKLIKWKKRKLFILWTTKITYNWKSQLQQQLNCLVGIRQDCFHLGLWLCLVAKKKEIYCMAHKIPPLSMNIISHILSWLWKVLFYVSLFFLNTERGERGFCLLFCSCFWSSNNLFFYSTEILDVLALFSCLENWGKVIEISHITLIWTTTLSSSLSY